MTVLIESLGADCSSELSSESLHAFVKTLLEHIPDDSSPKIMVVKPDLPAPTPIRPNGQKSNPIGVAYDPSIVFVLELATILAARDATSMDQLGREVAHALQGIVRDASQTHPVTLSRTVYYLLSFLRASHVRFSWIDSILRELTSRRSMTS